MAQVPSVVASLRVLVAASLVRAISCHRLQKRLYCQPKVNWYHTGVPQLGAIWDPRCSGVLVNMSPLTEGTAIDRSTRVVADPRGVTLSR